MQPLLKKVLASPFGQAALAFLRVAAATVVASWVHAGMPTRNLDGHSLVGWVELGLQAGVALVMANYVGPWEKRYGLGKTGSDSHPVAQ